MVPFFSVILIVRMASLLLGFTAKTTILATARRIDDRYCVGNPTTILTSLLYLPAFDS